MKNSPAVSATSLPRAPRDEASARSTRYLVTMAIRMVCLALMVLVQPFGWWTWAFAAGAAVLPYIAVILANVGVRPSGAEIIPPERAVAAVADTAPAESAPRVIRISESTAPVTPAPPRTETP